MDQVTYLCTVRTMYHVLKGNLEFRQRRNQPRHPAYAKPPLVASASNQVWTLDIAKLRGPANWTYYYVYIILDIYSRHVVGWMLTLRESEHLAERLLRNTLVKEGIHRDQVTIHGGRGPAKRSQAVAQELATLGATKLHRRPTLSKGYPDSESRFKTLKIAATFPDQFASYDRGLDFCRRSFNWHNEQRRDWGIGLLPPTIEPPVQGNAAVESRAPVLALAHARLPERFVRELPQRLAPAAEVRNNPPENWPQARAVKLPRDSTFGLRLSQSNRHVLAVGLTKIGFRF